MSVRDDLASFQSAFDADDAWIDIVPSFDSTSSATATLPRWQSSLPTLGPFRAGIPTRVPYWWASALRARSLCRVTPPAWWNATRLARIIRYEQTHGPLWPDATQLPRNYYELSRRLPTLLGNNSGEEDDPSIRLLVEDLYQIRVDKLRHQFQDLLANRAGDDVDDVVLTVTGIGTQELTLLRAFVTQALNDRTTLGRAVSHAGAERPAENPEAADDTAPAAVRARFPVRRFRR